MTAAIKTIFVAIVGRFMADEVKAWACWLHETLRRSAVKKLPAECRYRYDEEWESGLHEIPGEIFRLIYSLGLLRAAAGIRNTATKGLGARRAFAVLKRLSDLALSGVALFVLSPLMLGAAIAIKIDSDGPSFYSSARVGKKGRTFQCVKFRTMSLNARSPVHEGMQMNKLGSVLFNVTTGPRVTKLGSLLRRYSIDELPQFFNVLKGDMSLVGPRPPLLSEVIRERVRNNSHPL